MASRLASCFHCVSARKKEVPPSPPADPRSRHPAAPRTLAAPRTFSFEELAAATRNFSHDCRVVGCNWEGVYKGYLKSINQVVAIRLQPVVDHHEHASADQENMVFLAHVLKISALRHPNLMNLIGFCADGDHRILVHEYMPLGCSLEDHLHEPSLGKSPLDWNTRMTIAAGVARGLEYMHDKGVVLPCVGSSDILLGDGYHPKLSQYGLAENDWLAAQHANGWTNTYSPRNVTFGPEVFMTGRPGLESSVYGFGVVLLEMITGRRVIDNDQDAVEDRLLLRWAHPLLKDRSQFCRMADPALQGQYPSSNLPKAVTIASLCIQEKLDMRAPIGTIVKVLSRLAHDVDRPESSHHAATN